MNKDQAHGVAKDIEGTLQEKAGQVTGDREQQVKGLGKQVAGNVQKGLGNAKEAVKDAVNKL